MEFISLKFSKAMELLATSQDGKMMGPITTLKTVILLKISGKRNPGSHFQRPRSFPRHWGRDYLASLEAHRFSLAFLGNLLEVGKMFERYSVEVPSDDEDWMKLAYNAAVDAFNADEVPVGAVITRGNQPLAVTRNDVVGSGSVLGHCELAAIRLAASIVGDWRLNDCTLYVTKEPCPMCSGACVMSRIGRVVFAVGDGKMGCLGGCGCDFSAYGGFNHSFPRTSGILEQPCRELLQKFFQMRRSSTNPPGYSP
jgi:tRNA(adenine34) deaminase